MKKGKLYIKIFLSFLFLLVISEILIFSAFKIISNRTLHGEFQKFINSAVYILSEAVKEKLHNSNLPIDKNLNIKNFITKLGNDYELKIWIKSPNGKTTKSFNDVTPEVPELKKSISGKFFYQSLQGRSSSFFIKIPINFTTNKTGYIFIFKKNAHPNFNETSFLIGLISIGLIIALMLYPFSRYITKSLKKLTESADKISKGDLSQRVKVKSKDEIGELAVSFNTMAQTLENMIKGTKELTANISHELRSPLARIRVAQEILAEKFIANNDTIQNKFLNSIEDEIDIMDNLIGQVLLLSKLDIKKQADEWEDINIFEVIQNIIEKNIISLEKKSITVTFKPQKDLYIMNVIKSEIYTLISNLFDNAIKYSTKNGKINIDLNDTDNSIEIILFNTCNKLSNDELVNMFKPFYRTTKKNIPGSGLGLAISKKIIEHHNGSIAAFNTVDGLSIKIIFPFS